MCLTRSSTSRSTPHRPTRTRSAPGTTRRPTTASRRTGGGERVFCNPPYGRAIGRWVEKAAKESRKPGTLVVLLIPARTDTAYFHDHLYGEAELRFVRGRLKFCKDGVPQDSAPFPSMVAVLGERKDREGEPHGDSH